MKDFKPLVLIFLIFFVLACASKKSAFKHEATFDSEKAFAKANEQLEKKYYEEARVAFLEIKNRDLFFTNITNADRIFVYSVSGNLILQKDNVVKITLRKVSNRPLVFLINRNGKVVWKKLIMAID